MVVLKLILQNADSMKKILRILFVLLFAVAFIWTIFHPAKTETNLLRAIFSNSSADELVVKLSGRYSAKINVIAEANSPDVAASMLDNFVDRVDKNSFEIKDLDFSKVLKVYEKYNENFLAPNTAKAIENKDYEAVVNSAYERLYDPLGMMIVPLNEDPFLLFADYIKSLGAAEGDVVELDGKCYKILSLEANKDIALSPNLLNRKVKNLVEIQNELSDKEAKIYLSGAPIHSFYASSRSMVEINIISILSLIFIIGLCYFYFRNLKLIVPIIISLGLGILSGYMACSLVFSSIHVLTFVFSTTLIGICIDYSFHYFIERDLSKIFKSLTISMLTTISAFSVLLFSGVELLRQIAVYTITGLLTVYLIVVLFYPSLNITVNTKHWSFELSDKFKKIFVLIVTLVSALGFLSLKFNDDIRNLYIPSRNLLKAEQLFNKVTGGNKKVTFAVVNGDNIQDILEKEENITDKLDNIDYQCLSKYVPSIKKQKQNFTLRQDLYKNTLDNYAEFLSVQEQKKLLAQSAPKGLVDNSQLPVSKEFLLNDSSSIIVLSDFDNPELITNHGAKYIDVTSDISNKIQGCRKVCLKLLAPIFLLLFVFISCIYKPKNALKIITPSIIASIFSIGLVAITGQEINLFHILAIFLIIGFGLDYSVFRASCIKSSSDAVLLSCMTTIFSFLLLSFTGFKLIRSLGFILFAGLVVSYLSSLLFDYKEELSK